MERTIWCGLSLGGKCGTNDFGQEVDGSQCKVWRVRYKVSRALSGVSYYGFAMFCRYRLYGIFNKKYSIKNLMEVMPHLGLPTCCVVLLSVGRSEWIIMNRWCAVTGRVLL